VNKDLGAMTERPVGEKGGAAELNKEALVSDQREKLLYFDLLEETKKIAVAINSFAGANNPSFLIGNFSSAKRDHISDQLEYGSAV